VPLATSLVTVGSAASIGFGVWHFFVPRIWNWYAHFDPAAVELVLAVRAINVFFSLSLVLFGLVNLLLIHGAGEYRYAVSVVLGATCVLWAVRVAMQLVHPQGSMTALLQYGMLVGFAVVFVCYSAALILVLLGKGVR